MAVKKKWTRTVGVLLVVVMLWLIPGTLLAADPVPKLGYLVFQSNADQNFVVGTTATIYFKLYDTSNVPYSGSVSAYISDPDGKVTYVSVTGGGGNYSIANFTFDKEGTYYLYVWDQSGNASGSIEVRNAVVTTSGTLVVNSNNTVTVKVTDPDGNPLARKSITVDGTSVGANSTPYTTLYDGTFSFTMVPTQLGSVKFIYGGHIIGSMNVEPAYKPGGRIGTRTKDSAGLSVEVSQNGWTSANTVILTRDDIVADAMVAVPLSKKFDAPILMTPSNSLDPQILAEIRRLEARTVLIIGGTGAVSETVEQQLKAEGLSTVRFAGADRYDTAAQIAAWIGSPGSVYLAYGYGEPDALAVSAFAARNGIPILLTDTVSLPQVTKDRLQQLAPSQITILGGTGIISKELENQLRTQYAVKRWGGVDRYGTEQIILQNLLSGQAPLYLASALVSPTDVPTGKPFGDALLAAALAAKKNGFVVTIPPDYLPSAINYTLLFNKGYIPMATVVGNSSAINVNMEQKIQELLNH